MPRYRYTAKGMNGRVCKGSMEASDPADLTERLKQRELYCFRWREIEESRSSGLSPLKIRMLPPLCRQFSSMMAAGVPLGDILTVSIRAEGDKGMKKVLLRIRKAVYEGSTLSEAMEATEGIFPNLLVYMIQTGEASGRLDEILDRLAAYYSREEELAGKGSARYDVSADSSVRYHMLFHFSSDSGPSPVCRHAAGSQAAGAYPVYAGSG